MFTQLWYTVHIQLNGDTAERRKVLFRNIVLVFYNSEFRMIDIQPRWQMPPSYEMNISDPRCKLLHSPEPVHELIPLSVSRIGITFV